ncbi:serine endopeptidase [Colletotrichum truncatum]|uniref:Serine endopeptidase n=1 Tax=Colletotrichum truncatum TaxID=5467 RepID=A0ACC3ZFF5_COLTU|nr:serine endopeptidase [Colletotrichum truncatum]KAF6801772.1 serine endopeptidase [Colletotrichum truncatum]
MYLTTVLTMLSLTGLGAARLGVADNSLKSHPSTGTKRFIIEVAENSDLKKLTSELATHEGTKLYKTFHSEVFTGFSIETTIENAETLRILQGVSNVWRSRKVQMASVLNGKTFNEDTSAANYSIHSMTGVDKLHDAGILGKGVKVAVVDAGVDYTHPALGGGLGPDFKVIGGYDLVGETFWPDEGFAKNPDGDPMEIASLGHGTHVSGIIAGKTGSWQGVAPEASILSYKVFGDDDTGRTDEETLIEAFLRAHADGADIITASIGGRGGFSTNAWAEVASRLVDRGLIVTISAGNDGDAGLFFPDNGMSGESVLAVASLEPSFVPGMPFEVTFDDGENSNTETWGFFHGALSHDFPVNGSLKVAMLSYDPENVTVACETLPDDIDLSNALVVAPRGGCSGSTKRYVLKTAGAEHVLLFNNDKLFPMPSNWDTRGVEGLIGHDEGVALINALAEGTNVTFRFFNETEKPLVNMKNPAIVPSSFTSMGGLYDLQIKPDIAAPGSNIFSTLPRGKFGLKSGTSMATPYVAGIAALYISKYGGRWIHGPEFGKRLAAKIMVSGQAIKWNDGFNMTDYDAWAPVFQIGNGLVNATKVLDYRTELSWPKFALNDTAHFQPCHKINITNNCINPVTYKFSLQPAGGVEAIDYYADFNPGPVEVALLPTDMTPNVIFPEGEFIVNPGETKEATFHFKAPVGLNEDLMPVYTGRILITGSNNEQLAVPYMGVQSDIQTTFKRMFKESYPYIISTRNITRIEDKSTFSFDISAEQQDFPKLYVRTSWGASIVRWDIFESGWQEENWTYPPVVGENGFVGMAATWDNEWTVPYFDPEIHSEMNLVRGPLTELSRDVYGYAPYRFWWLGRLADGFKIKPGKYVMRIAALIPFGDPSLNSHWDTRSYNFTVVPNNNTLPVAISKRPPPPPPLHTWDN